MKLRWPVHFAIGVTVRCRSGQALRFTVDNINVTVNAFAKITAYNWQGGMGAPLFIDPEAMESISTNRVVRWRGWRDEPPAPPALDVEAQAAVTMAEPPTHDEVKVH